MSVGMIGYDPERVGDLRRRVRVAADDLAQLDCDDPASADAVRAVAIARLHLETEWLPLIERILESRAMTAPIAGSTAHPTAWRSSPIDDDEMRPPSSAEVASDLIAAADDEAVSENSSADTVVLSNGWSWQCGPVSATTGEPASSCEFMPPTDWDLLTPTLLVLSAVPVTGEAIDTYDCIAGDIPCEAVVLPFFSGRIGRAVDDILTATRFADRPLRDTVEILMPGGKPLGRPGTRPEIRVVQGDLADAEMTFVDLTRGGELVLVVADMIRVRTAEGGYITLRTKMTRSPGSVATIDVNIGHYPQIEKIKYNP